MNLLFPFLSKEQIHGQLQQINTAVESDTVSLSAADNAWLLLLQLWAAHSSLLLLGQSSRKFWKLGKAEAPYADSPIKCGTTITAPKVSLRAWWEYRTSLHLHLKATAASETQLSLSWFRDQLPFGIYYTMIAGKSTKNSLLDPP